MPRLSAFRAIRRAVVAASVVGICLSPDPARADYATPALGDWIIRSSTVGFGTVADVQDSQLANTFTLDVAIDEILAGAQRTGWTAVGSKAFSDGIPRLPQGAVVLVFIPATGAAGEAGLVPILVSAKPQIRAIIQTVVAKGTALRLDDVSDRLRTSSPELAGPPLVTGMLLEELTLRVTSQEESGVAAIACASDGYRSDARLWAVARSGSLRLASARVCLENLVATPAVGDLAVAAADALGDLGAVESVPVLLATLPPKTRDPKLKAKDVRSDVLVGTRPNDPEDESNPVPDTGESPGPGSDTFDGAAAGGGTSQPSVEVVGNPGMQVPIDPVRRRNDGGLAMAAVLSLGKIGSPLAVPQLKRMAEEGGNLALHSTIVNALGMIGDARALAALEAIGRKNPDPLVRTQATETLSQRQ
jgi:hypothetical protein